jgi:hypothetical protein
MSPIVGSTRPEAPVSVPTALIPEEELVIQSLRPLGRLPLRSALLRPAEPGTPPALSDIYWSR